MITTEIRNFSAVSAGHPMALTAIISDSILDQSLKNPDARVGMRVALMRNTAILTGFNSEEVPLEDIVSNELTRFGYRDPKWGLPANSIRLLKFHQRQDPHEPGVLAQHGLPFRATSFCSRETPEGVPIGLQWARLLVRQYTEERSQHPGAGPGLDVTLSVLYREGIAQGIRQMSCIVQTTDQDDQEKLREWFADLVNRCFTPVGAMLPGAEMHLIPWGLTENFITSPEGLTRRFHPMSEFDGYGFDPRSYPREVFHDGERVVRAIMEHRGVSSSLLSTTWVAGHPEPVGLSLNGESTMDSIPFMPREPLKTQPELTPEPVKPIYRDRTLAYLWGPPRK